MTLFLKILILVSAFALQSSVGAEVVRSNTAPATVNSQKCESTLENFRKLLLTQIGSTKKDLELTRDCYLNTTYSEALKKVCPSRKETIEKSVIESRGLERKARTQIARTWLSTTQVSELSESCVQRMANGDPILGPNSRIIDTKDNVLCQPLTTSWGIELSKLEADSLKKDGRLGTLSNDEKKQLLAFRNSAISGKLSERVKSDDRCSNEEMTNELKRGFGDLAQQANVLERYVRNLPAHELYHLYAFRAKFTEFATQLDVGQQTQAMQCMMKDGIVRDCFGDGQFASCISKSSEFLTSLIPVISIVDAFEGFAPNRAAFDTGFKTVDEYASTVATLSVQGIAGIAVTGSIAKALGRKLLPSSATEVAAAGESAPLTTGAVANVNSVPGKFVMDGSPGRATYGIFGPADRYVGSKGAELDYFYPPHRVGGYPVVIGSNDAELLRAVANGAKIKPAPYSEGSLSLIEQRMADLGKEGRDRLLSTIDSGVSSGSPSSRVVYSGPGKVRPVNDAEFSPSPGLERNGITGVERLKIANPGKERPFEALDSPSMSYAGNGMTNYRTSTRSIGGDDVQILVGDKVIRGRYISAGGRDLPAGASPNHFKPQEIEVHFIQVGDDIVTVPAKDARVFVQR